MLHICADEKQIYAKIVFFTSSLLENGGLGPSPRKFFVQVTPS